MKLKPIEQQVVIVFGASSGIGRETAKQFAARGARVVIAARGEEGLDSLADEIRSAGGQVIALSADTADFQQVKAVADQAAAEYGHLDTWVHLAAVSIYAPFEQTSPDEFKQIVEVNLVGQAYGAMAALPHLERSGGGALIHVSSVEAVRALPYHAAYAASKHGLKGMLDALRLELKHEGAPVSVTNIMPASINTPFFDTAPTRLGVKPRGIPPYYEPEVVARTILYAAEHPVAELFAGGAGKMLATMQRLSPRLADAMLLATAFKGQKTDEPKSAAAPNSLFAPQAGQDRVHGDFGKEARSWSVYTWLETHPAVRFALGAAAAGGVAVFAMRTLGDGRD